MSPVYTGMGPTKHDCILLLLLGCIFKGISVTHRGEVLDLMPSRNASQMPGIQFISGLNKTPAIYLTDGPRHILLSDAVSARAQKILNENTDITFLATLKQEEGNSGSILSFSSGITRILEIENSGRRNEVRFHYTHDQDIQVETFPYRLADNHWHRLALSLSATHLTVFVDCEQIYKRVILALDRKFKAGKLSLFLGQRNGQHAFFRGALQDVKIVTKSHGFLAQCPDQDTNCPTCAQHQQLQKMYEKMQTDIQKLNKKLLQAEERLLNLEQCPCHYCYHNGTIRKEGERWSPNKCTICICKNATVECKRRDCSKYDCPNPVYRDCCKPESDDCCLSNDKNRIEYYNPGDKIQKNNCYYCSCDNASMVCKKISPESCPSLNCSENNQINVDGKCCPICKGTNFCALGHECHANATCKNLDTRYACLCKSGFDGVDGKFCQDIDECATVGGKNGHLCRENTICVNTIGSYQCQCATGLNSYDEDNPDGSCEGMTVDCSPEEASENTCHEHATCTVIGHMYRCKCNEGYRGNGRWCQPICEFECKNRGRCVAPNVCECRYGYSGKYCQTDIDECALGIDACKGQSECVNLPGWYYCRCKPGFESFWHEQPLYGLQCGDLNECLGEGDGHTCHPTTTCFNTEGSYECKCNYENDCAHSCIYEGYYHENSTKWISEIDMCSQCKCTNGVTKCEPNECKCNAADVNLNCCPQCTKKGKCEHQEELRLMAHGEKWVFQCQTCECLNGEIDCWPLECPQLTCSEIIKVPGDCCPRCKNDEPCHENDRYSIVNVGLPVEVCRYRGRRYQNNEIWKLDGDRCTSCKCKRGHICCSFNQTCTDLERFP